MPTPCLSELLIRAVKLHGSRIAIGFEGREVRYADLDAQSDKLAGFLASRGVDTGDAVALNLPHGVEYLVADLAILKLGGVKVPLSDMMSGDEIDYCLDHSAAKALLSAGPAPTPPSGVSKQLHIRVGPTDPASVSVRWEDALLARPLDRPRPVSPEAPASIVYTGGTTGKPKGIVHRQGPQAQCLLSHIVNGEIGRDEVMLLTTPLPHSAGWFAQAGLFQGARIELARFDAKTFLDTVVERRVTWTFAVPTMLYRVLAETGGATRPPSMRTIIYGAAPMDPNRLQEARRFFGDVFVQLYGQSECPNFITRLTKDDHARPELLASCGRPVAFAEVRVGDETASAEAGSVGEISVRCPYVMEGYLNPGPGVESPFDGLWMRTGDLGYVTDAGYLFLVDRAKDMIISGGLNIYCAEVENALRKDDRVRDAAVIGAPDADWGERVVAIVVAEKAVDAAALIAGVRDRLAAYKIPKALHFADALPTTRFGKIDKKQLRATFVDGR